MLNNFSTEYSERGEDELLRLVSDRASLTTEAAAALDAELRRRNLTESDQVKYHQQFVKRNEKRAATRRRRRIFGTRRDRRSWVDVFWALITMALISFTYVALPSRYHMNPDWQQAAIHVLFSSVFIAVFSSSWRQKIVFWVSLALSSAIHIFIVHGWIQRVGNLSREQGELAILLGFVVFFAVYGLVWMFQRNFYGEEARNHT